MCNANDSASRSRTSITRELALLVSALTQIIGTSVDHEGAAKHTFRAKELDVLVRDATFGITLTVGLVIAEVTDMALAI